MKVKAIGMGNYKNRIIERGQEFEIDDARHFSSRWMEKIAEKPVERRKEENREEIEEQLKAEKLGVA